MAQALIKAVDFVHPDPDVDAVSAHKRGDVIVVMPDSHVWGSLEGPPKFQVVNVPDSWLGWRQHYVGMMEESGAEAIPLHLRKTGKLRFVAARAQERKRLRRHRFAVDLDNGNTVIDKRLS